MTFSGQDDVMSDHEVEWTPEERAALDALPRQMAPPPALEERTVGALRRMGVLGDVPRRARPGGAWWVAAAAAAVAVFLGGVQVGQRQGTRLAVETITAVRGGDARDAAADVQRTAGAYLSALAILAERMPAADSAAVDQARQVVQAALAAAAREALRVTPDDAMAAAIRAVSGREEPVLGMPRQVLWF
jgi:hypothetical protein